MHLCNLESLLRDSQNSLRKKGEQERQDVFIPLAQKYSFLQQIYNHVFMHGCVLTPVQKHVCPTQYEWISFNPTTPADVLLKHLVVFTTSSVTIKRVRGLLKMDQI